MQHPGCPKKLSGAQQQWDKEGKDNIGFLVLGWVVFIPTERLLSGGRICAPLGPTPPGKLSRHFFNTPLKTRFPGAGKSESTVGTTLRQQAGWQDTLSDHNSILVIRLAALCYYLCGSV